MKTTLNFAAGAAFALVLVTTCGKMAGPGDAGAQSGPSRTLTADTDVNQLSSGVALQTDANGVKVVDGPFVLTDTSAQSLWAVAAGQDCSQASLTAAFSGTGGRWITSVSSPPIAGAHLFIAATETLCANTSSAPRPIGWSGFRPY